MILVTGGAGFIGANFVLDWLAATGEPVVNLDKLTYAGNLGNLAALAGDARHEFVRGDIGDRTLVASLLTPAPAAGRSSTSPRRATSTARFTDRRSSLQPMSSARSRCSRPCAPTGPRSVRPTSAAFRFLHVSTDEVYGSLGPARSRRSRKRRPTRPTARTRRRRPHPITWCAHGITRTACRSLTTNCSNNYGPRQFPEKLIPLMIVNALAGKPLPVYGDGGNVRDWLYVGDHCAAIRAVLARGRHGETYNVGGNAEMTNLEVVRTICGILGELRPGRDYAAQIAFVKDRPGHDRRYAIDAVEDSARARLAPGGNVRDRHAADGAMVSRQRRVARQRHERRLPQMDHAQLRERGSRLSGTR